MRTAGLRGPRRAALAGALAGALAVALAGCGSPAEPTGSGSTAPRTAPPSSPASSAPASAAPGSARPGSAPPAWLGQRPLPQDAQGYGVRRPTPPSLRDRRFTLPDTVTGPAGTRFWSRVEAAPASVLARSTWTPDCPVAAAELSWVRLAFWGFDGRRHLGELLVHRSVARDVVTVFRELFAMRFPVEEMRITRRDELDAPPTGDGNDTGAFTCRPKAGRTTGFSEHAYGLAIDLNPFQNPYRNGRLVLPELASSYLRRDRVRPGMITAGGPVVRAFARIGWGWGGAWRTLKDYQHFSLRDH